MSIFFFQNYNRGGYPKDFSLQKNKKFLNNKNLLIAELENKETEGRHKNYLIKKRLDYCLWQNINFSYKIKFEEIFKIYFEILYSFKKYLYFKLVFKNFYFK